MSDLSPSASEAARLAALYRYRILDTPEEEEFDDFTRLAAGICGTPVAMISLIDRHRQWFKSVLGFELRETPLDLSICRHAMLRDTPLILPDIREDECFRDNPLVRGEPHLRFYAGAPLETPEGQRLGTLCVLDYEPREITADQRDALATLARKVMDTLELRLSRELLHDTITSISDAFLVLDHDGRILHFNDEARSLLVEPEGDLRGRRFENLADFPGKEALLEGIARAAAGERTADVSFAHESSGRHFAARIYPARGGVTVSCRDVTGRRESERQLKLLQTCVDHARDTLIITEAEPLDEPGPRIVYVNDAFVELTGYSREEALGSSPRMLQGPRTQRDALDRIRAGLRAGRTVREELINHRKDGEPFWLELEITPVAGEDGAPGHFIAVQREISERKHEEAERRGLIRDLGERIKELEALHRIADLLRKGNDEPEALLERVAGLIPGAMQFPEIAGARVEFDGMTAATERFNPRARWSLAAPFTTTCGARGSVKVVYRAKRPEACDGPFLKDEVRLVDSVAEMLRGYFDRTRAHAALRTSEERFRRIFENAATGIAIATPAGRFLHANPALCKMLGYRDNEMRRLDVRTITVPEDRENTAEQMRELRAGERGSYVAEKRYRHKSGAVVWVRVSVSILRAEDEEPLMVGVVEDITQRKRAERSLAESERRFRQLAESMPVIVWTATPEGEVAYANHQFYDRTGASSSEPVRDVWLECLHPDDRELCMATWMDCVKTGEPFFIEYRVRNREGEYRWTRVQAQPIRDDQERIIRWFGTGIDIHRTRQLQEEASRLAHSLTTTLESITDAFITIGRDWEITYVNREAEKQFAVDRDEIGGRDLLEEIAPRAGARFRAELERGMVENVTVAFEEHFPELDQWFDVRAYPSVEGLAIYLRNITEARRQREALADSEERFRLLSKATDDVIWDWDIRENALWWNGGLPSLYAGEPGHAPPAFEAWSGRVHPDDRDRVVTGLHRAVAGADRMWSDEYRFRRTDGSYAHIFDRGTLIRDADGEVVRMIGGMSDISKRKEAENKLREQATLLDKAQDAILVRDLDHRILYWNRSAERLYGWTGEEALGASIEELLYREPDAFRAATAETLATGEWVGELEQFAKDGGTLTIEGRWSLVRDDDGEPRSILAINTDITERKRLEQQFLRAQRMESIGTLAGGIAHDLNNVLAPILMAIDLLKVNADDEGDRQILDTIETSARRGADMVSQVLSFARGVEGRRVEVGLGPLVEDITRISRETFPKNIRFETRMAPDLWTLEADPTQLHQVLLNLCVNARDAMPDGGGITIEAENESIDGQYAATHLDAGEGDYVRLTISDQGHGIPAAELEKIFDPFFTTKEVGAGTGLGLSTTLAIVRSHGGFIHVDSRPGHGTRFSVHLPARTARTPVEAKEAPRAILPRGRGETVLLVDDERSVLEVTERTLASYGYRVLTASDGAEGFSVYVREQERVDVVITDVAMPVMDGPTMIRAIHRLQPEVPVIAASGFAAGEEPADAPDVRLTLVKPYNAERLLGALHAVLNPAS